MPTYSPSGITRDEVHGIVRERSIAPLPGMLRRPAFAIAAAVPP